VKAGTAAAAMVAVGSRQAMALASAASPSTIVPSGGGTAPAPAMDASVRALLMDALNAATLAGAGYADARVGRTRNNFVFTREHQIIDIVDTDTMGCGVRVLVDGTWGFAATRTLTSAGVAGAARAAVGIAKANRVARDLAVELAPAPRIGEVTWQSAFTVDPFTVPIEQKADLLLRTNAEALKVKGVQFVESTLYFVKEEKNFASTDGATVAQTLVRSWSPIEITAVAGDHSDFQSRANTVPPMGRGWEYIVEQDLVGHAAEWAEQAAEKLKAKPVEVGRHDLVLHPSHLWLTIHESIAHPTELDRARGYEANLAGTSFVAPPDKVLGMLRYGPEFMTIQADRSQVGGLSSVGVDDEGVVPETFSLIGHGVVSDYQTTREQANWLKWWYDKTGQATRSHGCSYADAWSNVQFQRMPNVSLVPGEKDLGWEDLIAATDRGIAIIGDGSFSIDQQRYNAQFGGQLFYEIRGGKIVGMLKDVAYQIRTPDFWRAMQMIGGKKSYELHGTFFDGKGQPTQTNAVSHGAVPARFQQINVINTGRTA
jgi:TldD protein